MRGETPDPGNLLPPGSPLSTILEAEGRLEVPRALEYLRWIGAALDEAHSRGEAHGALDPSRIFIGAEGGVSIRDWSAWAGLPGSLIPMVEFLSPELLRGEEIVPESDQFSLAAIGCQMLNGGTPFAADSPVKSMYRILLQPVDGTALPNAPAEVRTVLCRGLARYAHARYGSCAEFVAALERNAFHRVSAPTRFADAPSSVVPLAPMFGQRPDPIPERQPGILKYLVLAIVLVGALVVGGLYMEFGRTPAMAPATVPPAAFGGQSPVPRASGDPVGKDTQNALIGAANEASEKAAHKTAVKKSRGTDVTGTFQVRTRRASPEKKADTPLEMVEPKMIVH